MPHKILILGAKGYNRQSLEVEVRNFRWNQLPNIESIGDFDTVIINLLSRPPIEEVDWKTFFRLFHPSCVNDVVAPGGGQVPNVGVTSPTG
jgi:hypothetical protein